MHKWSAYIVAASTLLLTTLGYMFLEMSQMKTEIARQGQQINDISENVHYLVDRNK